jgi:hypothetical protein
MCVCVCGGGGGDLEFEGFLGVLIISFTPSQPFFSWGLPCPMI